MPLIIFSNKQIGSRSVRVIYLETFTIKHTRIFPKHITQQDGFTSYLRGVFQINTGDGYSCDIKKKPSAICLALILEGGFREELIPKNQSIDSLFTIPCFQAYTAACVRSAR